MKKLSILAISAVLAVSAFAQEINFYYGPSGKLKGKGTLDIDSNYKFEYVYNLDKFLKKYNPNIYSGVAVSYDHSKISVDSLGLKGHTDSFNIGVKGGYNFQMPYKITLTPNLGLFYSHQKLKGDNGDTTDLSGNGWGYTLGVKATYATHYSVSLEYMKRKIHYSDSGVSVTTDEHITYLGLGYNF